MAGRLPDPGGSVIQSASTPTTTGGRLPAPSALGRLPEPAQPAINPTPWGFVKNLIGDVGELASGITGLVGAAGHDIVAGVQELIPGEQQTESEGYIWAKIAKGFVPAVIGDYKNRYGGASNIARGLYEDPLSYILDAVALGTGVGAAAQAGRGAGILGKLPTLMPEAAASKVLGPALRAGEGAGRVSRYGTLATRSLEGGTQALKLSRNPVVRAMQQPIYKGLTQTADELRAADLVTTARAAEVAAAAEAAGMRILTPNLFGRESLDVGAYFTKHDTSKILSAVRVNKRDLTHSEAQELQEILGANPRHPERGLDQDAIGRILQREALPETTPDLDAIPFEQLVVRTGRLEDPPMAGPFNPDDAETLARWHGQDVSIVAPEAPYAPGGGAGQLNRYQLAVASLDDAETVAEEALRRVDADPIGAYAPLSDAAQEWDSLSFFGRRRSDGSLIEISVGTPRMLRAQSSAARTGSRIGMLEEKLRIVQDDIKRANTPEEALPKADEMLALQENIAAGKQWTREIFDDTRARYWADHDGAEYVPELEAAMRARAWVNDSLVERWFEYFPEDASYATMMERAYGPQRVSQFWRNVAEMAPEFRAILEGSPDPTTAAAGLTQYLSDQGIPAPLIQQILGRSLHTGRGLDAAVTRLVKKARQELYPYLVEEGGHGARFGFDEYDWRVMREAAAAQHLPTPVYMPHFPKRSASSYMTQVPQGVASLPRPGVTKGWRGLLYATGSANPNAYEAYTRAAQILTNHQETYGLIKEVMSKFGRKVPSGEVKLSRHYGDGRYAGEVYTSPGLIKSLLGNRGRVMSDAVLGAVDDGLDNATLGSIDSVASQLFLDGIDNLAAGEVWALPRSVAETVRREIALQLGHNTQLFWDTPMNLWKASVLSLSPRWVMNNFFGNLVFMGIENPGAIRYALSQLDKKNRTLAEALLGPEVLRATERGFFHDVNPIQGWGTKINILRNFNSKIEEAARRGVLIDNVRREALQGWVGGFHSSFAIMKQAAREGVDSRLMDRAIRSVDTTVGNFMQYSPVEQGILRRFLMPFYGFYRHMAKVTVRLPFEHPLKAKVLDLIEQMNNQMESELPEYLQDQGTVFLGEIMGHDTLLRLRNLNPLSQLHENIPMISLLNPALKVALERQLGMDTFTGESFETPDDMIQTFDGRYWQIERDGAGNVLGVSPAGKPLPSLWNHIGGQFGIANMLPTFQRYPKSAILNIASWAGLPASQPKTSLESSAAFDQEMEQAALAQAQNQADPFAAGFDTSTFKF